MAEGSAYGGLPANVPESVRARIAAARLLQEGAAQQTAPYTSKGVVALKGIEGLLGGLQEHQALQDMRQGQAAGNASLVALGAALRNGASPAAMASGSAVPASGMIPGSSPTGPANALPAGSSPISTASQNAFIQSALPHAQAVAAQTGIDPRLIVAQAALESNYGKSAPGGNLFGIKGAGSGPVSTMESVNGKMTPTLASFAAYGSPEASFAGYGKLMSHDRYASVRNGATLDDQLSALGKSGYATDPNYAAKVGAIARGIDPGMIQAARGPSTAAPGINAPLPAGAGNTDPGISASAAPIGDAAVLAARNRLASGGGTDADRATVGTYLQQQNAPPANRTASADAPAPNAQPVSSSTLPLGVTPAMFDGSAPPSPFGGMPSSMAQPQPAGPDAATLAAALRGQAGGSGPGATPIPATVQPSSPFGSLPASMDQAPAAPPTGPMMASAPSLSPAPSPFGASPSPMAPQGGADPKMVAQLLAQGGAGSVPPPDAAAQAAPQSSPFGAGPQPMQGTGNADPAMVAALLKRGAPTPAIASPAPDPSIMQAAATSAPPMPPLSSSAVAMGDLGPVGPGPAALDPSGAALPPVQASGLSTDNLPGFDNFAPDGSVRQSSLGAAGFTGTPDDGSLQAAISGNLRGPQAYVGGPLGLGTGAPDPSAPAPGTPSPAVMAAALRQGAPSPQPGPMSPPPAAQPPAPPPAAPAGQQNAALMPGGVDDFGRTPDQAMGGTPSLPDVTTAAMAKAGYDTTGLPGVTPKPTAPMPTMASANVPPPDLSGLAGSTTPPPGSGLPIMQRPSSNPPAEVAALAAGLSSAPAATTYTSTEPSSRPGAQAMRQPKPGDADGPPLPTPRPSNAALGLNPDAPAPNAVQAGPAPVSPQVMGNLLRQQPMGLAGNSPVSDPSSAQSFMRQEAQRASGSPGYTNPTARALAGQPAPAPQAAQQDDGNPLAGIGRLFGMGGGSGGGLGGMLGNLPVVGGMLGGQGGGQMGNGFPFGGSGNNPSPTSAPATSAAYGGQAAGQSFAPGGQGQQAQGSQAGGLSQAQAIAGQILNNQYALPEAREAASKVLFATPTYQKLENGDLYKMDPLGQSAPQLVAHGGKFEATKTGIIYNQGTGLGVDGPPVGGANAYRPMTPAELKGYGITDGRPSFIGPGGEPHFGMPEAQGQGETAVAKTAGEAAANRRNDKLTGAMAAPEKIARLSLLGSVLDKTQTGPLAGEAGTAASVATRLGIPPERLAQIGIDPNQAVNNAIANKLAGEMTMGSIGAKNGGMPASNFSVAERQFIEALYPSIENQAGGNRAVTDVLTAVEQRKLQVADEWSAYKDRQAQAGKPLSYENFEDGFRRAHSQDNIFAPIIQKYQAGAYTPTVPTPGGAPTAQGQPPSPQAPAMDPRNVAPGITGAPQGGGYLPGAARGPAAASQAQPSPSAGSMPPPAAVAALRSNPGLQAQFDAKYGQGASARALGQ